MTERNWVAPKGCSYVIDTNVGASGTESYYGGHLVAESIFNDEELTLILAAPGQAKRIKELEAELRDWRNDT